MIVPVFNRTISAYKMNSIKDNRVYLFDKITDISAEKCIEHLELASFYDSDIIELHISSPGGLVSEAESIIDVMQSINKPIYSYIHNSYVYDGVGSAASVIVSYTHRKHIYNDAIFMIHHAHIKNKVIEDDEDILYWMHHTNLDFETINYLIKNEIKNDADTTLNLGFVDEILYD